MSPFFNSIVTKNDEYGREEPEQYNRSSARNKKSVDDEVAIIVDILASEYGWTIEYILSLPKQVILKMLKAIAERYEGSKHNEKSNSLTDGESKLSEMGILKVKNRRT